MSSTILLASTSPYRRALLERLGIRFDAIAPTCDEEALKDPNLAPRDLAEHLADAKAASIASAHPDAIVIGSDQVATDGDQVLDKPGTAERALAQLTRLVGRTHYLITAMVIRRGDDIRRHTDVTSLTMRNLDQAALQRTIDRDNPVDCAGAYKLECSGITLFERIESADQTAITGLPLIATTSILLEFGVSVP